MIANTILAPRCPPLHLRLSVSRTDLIRLQQKRNGFVGDKGDIAGEYHQNDFSWEDLYESEGYRLEEFIAKKEEDVWKEKEDGWNRFFAVHKSAKFFKERRYLLLEFPCLTRTNPPLKIIEFGSGYGSSILPIMKNNPTCTCVAVDISPDALEALKALALEYNISTDRLETYTLDISRTPAAATFELSSTQADYVLMVFVLSAVDPRQMDNALSLANRSLKPGGSLLFRDYGFCDMTQFRYPAAQRLGRQSYYRLDGTRAYYFEVEELIALCEKHGFCEVECEYVCTETKNRKARNKMKRVYLHGLFRKKF